MLIRSPHRCGRAARAEWYAARLGRLEIDHQFILGRRLHRQLHRFLALEDAMDVARGAPELIDMVRAVRECRDCALDLTGIGHVDRTQLHPNDSATAWTVAKAQHPLGLLRPRGHRPRCFATPQSNELTPPHSRSSSTMTRPHYQMITHRALWR